MSVPLPEKGSLNLQLSLPSLQQIMEHCIALSLRIRMSLDGLWDIGVGLLKGFIGAMAPWTLTPLEAGSSLACGQECEATLAPECTEANQQNTASEHHRHRQESKIPVLPLPRRAHLPRPARPDRRGTDWTWMKRGT